MGSGIAKLFNGYIVNDISFYLSIDNEVVTQQPKAGKAWLILGGHYYHMTGDVTTVWVTKNPDVNLPTTQLYIIYEESILAGVANGAYNLFNSTVGGTNGSWRPIFVFPNMAVKLTGLQNAQLHLQVLEFDV